MQAELQPEVGFVRRGNMGEIRGEVAGYRLQRAVIRNLTFDASVDYFKGGDGLIETHAEGRPSGWTSRITRYPTSSTNTFDRLMRPFAIRPNVSSPSATMTIEATR